MLNSATNRYRADIGGGPLKLPEARIIADLLLQGVTEDEWKKVIEVDNILRKRSIGTAKRQASLIRARLKTMDSNLWEIVRDSSSSLAMQALYASAIKHSPLLGDFIDMILRDQMRLFKPSLSRSLWRQYIDHCKERDPEMSKWQESTENKLGDSVFQILAEVGYLNNTKDLRIQTIRISNDILEYLKVRNEGYVVKCLQLP